jgi:beta-galactosidase GanA
MENTERDLQVVRKVAPQIMTKRAIADAKEGKYNPPSWKGTGYLHDSLLLLSTETVDVDREQMAKIARENVEYFSELYEKAYRKYMLTRAKVA